MSTDYDGGIEHVDVYDNSTRLSPVLDQHGQKVVRANQYTPGFILFTEKPKK